MHDEKIIELYWNRDESAINETAVKYESYLSKIAFNILADAEDAKESVNDTYLAAWNSIPPNKPTVLSAYLRKLVRRISIDRLRKRSREKRIPSEYMQAIDELNYCLSDPNTPETEYETKLLAKAINDFLLTLPEESRNIFICRYYFFDSLKEASAYCGISESKAKSMLFRIRNDLKTYLRKEEFDL